MESLRAKLRSTGYWVADRQVIQLVRDAVRDHAGEHLPDSPKQTRTFEEYVKLMAWGDILRDRFDSAFPAKLVVKSIGESRELDVRNAISDRKRGLAYLITHLVHPDEAKTLRSVYGSRFFLIGINAPRQHRTDRLESRLASGAGDSTTPPPLMSTGVGRSRSAERRSEDSVHRQHAQLLVDIDAGLVSAIDGLRPSSRLNVDKTFQEADLFLTSGSQNDDRAQQSLDRFVRQLFSDPYGTPTSDELAMSAAFLAAKSSVALGRSVGAVLADQDGSVEAWGWNEVAAPGGGPYRDDPSSAHKRVRLDNRDHVIGFDPSDPGRVDAIRSFLEALLNHDDWVSSLDNMTDFPNTVAWLTHLRSKLGDEVIEVSDEVVQGLSSVEIFAETRIMNLIEFGRSVHAEVATLSDAARRGIASKGKDIFVTTFPCHECCRNLISFGIRRVIYVEPYGKSMAPSLYASELMLFGEASWPGVPEEKRVRLDPFVGIAPRFLESGFSAVPRKTGMSEREDVPGGGAFHWELTNTSVARLRPSFVGYPVGFDASKVYLHLESALLGMESVIANQVNALLPQLSIDNLKG